MNRIIQGLWVGSELSTMEQMSIASFIHHGHEYHLYVYEDVRNLPSGTIIRDASEILPPTRIFKYKRQPSYAGFSNFFRYKLLLERGGWWIDTDTICLKPFDFTEPYVFSSELVAGRELITSGIIKAPAGSDAMAYAWEVCQSKDPEQLVWGETGPKLVADAVARFSLDGYRKSHRVFCPIGYTDWGKVLLAETQEVLDGDSYAIHLWNEMWRASGQDKNGDYDPDCLYERLKRSYLRNTTGAI